MSRRIRAIVPNPTPEEIERELAERLEPDYPSSRPQVRTDWKYNIEGQHESPLGLWESEYDNGELNCYAKDIDGNFAAAVIKAMERFLYEREDQRGYSMWLFKWKRIVDVALGRREGDFAMEVCRCALEVLELCEQQDKALQKGQPR